MLERAYVEIGNICNLTCSFCHGTKRAKRQMSIEEFTLALERLRGRVKYLYLHVMGEPLLHPYLDSFLDIANSFGFRVCITTNGTLLGRSRDMLLRHTDVLHKVSVSLHAPEGSGIEDRLYSYIDEVCSACKSLSEAGVYSVLRLWNADSTDAVGKNDCNALIEELLHSRFKEEWQSRRRGYRLARNIFLEYDGVFVWPADSEAEPRECGFCHGLTQQIGILADGSVVPCCLDAEGDMTLGNIFESSLEEILTSPRAAAMRSGLAKGVFTEPLCRSCTYSRRFSGKD